MNEDSWGSTWLSVMSSAFLSKTLSPTERNYEIYDRELLGIIQALEEWQHYIQGSSHTTIVFSDHKNLTYFWTAQKLNRRQARWSLYLSEFNISLIHLPRSKMIQSDTLSRWPDYGLDNEHDNKDIILLPDIVKMFHDHETAGHPAGSYPAVVTIVRAGSILERGDVRLITHMM